MSKKRLNDIVVDKIKELHKWQNKKLAVYRWKCYCCKLDSEEQKSMWRRTRRVLKQMLIKEPLE